jgi:mono/diheme cytochrome c family protein
MRRRVLELAAAVMLAGCGESETPAPAKTASPPPASAPPAAAPPSSAPVAGDPAKGRQVYVAQCTACHNADPARIGPVGPPVRGVAPEVLATKVLRGTYPPGYTPQRDSRVMPPRPDLAPAIPDLLAYLR